ncbi:TPA: helix-turn-helix transcriptional regulator [Clostridioides difficile]|uniref:helix-turn-helix domain-containing protein n=1 Tax=Clostridioides difficile TaxID=1496 RepID=UPI00038D2027|nr:helix-turn-helix transcriptional regulator [Clostridioides difficile]EGT4249721.1 XRE family transcriptional regulator [Clostridioides difficile]EGT5405265.1 XRE family transcriptional regulator [Clostridioides difficile]EGT5477531.1 XRE family transcriptional regulator [Clostridioides difficile]EGT5510701.1 XRE family transcriptional regulator [Clostridioides difficile]EGT5540546.1 XRE family transcriptional regulator [Clostridioides difficile]
MDNNLIGTRIRNARKNIGYTQSELAEVLFISESYLALIELGKRTPSLDILIKIVDALGISLDFLVNGDNSFEDSALYKEWNSIIKGKSSQEIKSAYNILREFFKCIDNCSNDYNKTNN